MTDVRTCPKCGAEVHADSPAGICPKCLMKAGIVTESEPGATGSRFVPAQPQELAPYFPDLEILELLGHGGMGAVYKARQKKLDRPVALKIIRPEFAQQATFAARFQREARTLARLNHPNIVAVHDFGEVSVSGSHSDQPRPATMYYFLMEYVDGTTLRELIKAGHLQPQQALAVVPQICEALQFAHDEGVVHRDIKPENILLNRRGLVKIADFGLARLVQGPQRDFTLTEANQVMGTPRYMAPEQMEGSHAVDHRADIFSLGVVFYEMLTGQTPAGHFEPPSKKVAIDVRLDEVVLRSMAREPERRYQQASEVKSEVESISQVGSPNPSSIPSATVVLGDAITNSGDLDFVEIESDLNGPSIAMMVVGSLIFAGHAAMLFACLSNRLDDDMAVFAVPGIVIGIGMFVGGLNMQQLSSRGWAQFGVVAGLIPASGGWLVSVPIAIWAHWVLQRPEVRRAFIERARQRQSSVTPTDSPGGAGSVQGIGRAIGWTVLHSVLWAAFFIVYLVFVPLIDGLVTDFDLELPTLAVMLVRASHQLVEHWYLLLPLAPAAMVADFAILQVLGRVRRWMQSLVGILLSLVPLVLGLILLLFCGLPMIKLIETLT